MSKYDYFIAGRWRNRDAINEIVEQLRAAGKTVHSFTEKLETLYLMFNEIFPAVKDFPEAKAGQPA